MRKGQKKRVWTPEQKLEIIKKYLEDHIPLRTMEKEYNAERSMINYWVHTFSIAKRKNTVNGLDKQCYCTAIDGVPVFCF